MIARLSGTIAAREGDRIMVETAGGVGYEVLVPRGVLETLPALGQHIALATVLVVREEGWALYGFAGDRDRRVFQRLLGASGVGPRLALALLSGLGTGRLLRALRERDVAVLASVPGIGKKTAERLGVELADKLADLEGGEAPAPRSSATEAALQALVRLGYTVPQADAALRAALVSDGSSDTATLLRRALQRLAQP